jgi:hypothetical protein
MDADRRENAVAELIEAVTVLEHARLDRQLLKHGWTPEVVSGIRDYFSILLTRLEGGWAPSHRDGLNMSSWFDSVGVTLHADDRQKEAVHRGADAFNVLARAH